MSCYEWESGTIIIPADQWKIFRESIIEEANRLTKNTWTKAVRLYMEAKEDPQRFVNRYCKPCDHDHWTCVRFKGKSYEWRDVTERPTGHYSEVTYDALEQLGLPAGGAGTKKAPLLSRVRKPKTPKLQPKSRSARFDNEDAVIILDNKTHSVTWHVMENNHACERAHLWPLAQHLFSRLRTVRWTARSGGQIVGNNEYNQDDYEAGGGANYIAFSYGSQTV